MTGAPLRRWQWRRPRALAVEAPLHAALAPPELAALARCVADAAAAAGDEHAAPLDAAQPVLAAAALHRGRSGIGQWWQALRAAPLQVVSTTARCALL